jgi:NDP-sugar pyrophosphorylase family protein
MRRAIVLAGGYGTRLAGPEHDGPSERPKALTPIGGVPILEIILHQLHDAGFEHVTLCLFWRAEQIAEHLGDGSQIGLEIAYSITEQRLGSAGPLAAVDPVGQPHLVLNCDLLTTLDYGEVLQAHRRVAVAATVVALRHESRLDYGMLELSEDGLRVRGQVEKPRIEHVVSAGIYVLGAAAWQHLEPGTYLDMPTLLGRLIGTRAPITALLMDREERWFDMGRRETCGEADEAFRSDPGRFLPGPSGRALLAAAGAEPRQKRR